MFAFSSQRLQKQFLDSELCILADFEACSSEHLCFGGATTVWNMCVPDVFPLSHVQYSYLSFGYKLNVKNRYMAQKIFIYSYIFSLRLMKISGQQCLYKAVASSDHIV